MTSRQLILVLILGLTLVRGLIYASFVPPWQAPDEPAHFERTRAALSATAWNSSAEDAPAWYDDLISSLFTYNYWDFLPGARLAYGSEALLGDYIVLYQEAYAGLYSTRLPYAMMGWPLFFAGDQEIAVQLYLVRLNTILMNVAIVFMAYLITRTIFPDNLFLILGVPIVIMFNPQHTHLLSAVNNGNLAELLTMIALYFIIKGVIEGYSWWVMLAILAFSILALRTKATAYFLPGVIGVMGLFYLWRYRRYWYWLLPAGAALAGLLYLFAPERITVLLSWGWIHLKAGDFYLDPIIPPVQFRSYWAMPGWLTLQLHPFWYQLLATASILGLVGLLILLVRRWRLLFAAEYQPRIQALILLAVAAVTALAIIWGWSALTNTIVYRQGRSLYPAMVSISIFLLLGWQQLIPSNWRNPALLTLTVGLFLFDTMVLFDYLIPFFYSRY